jgi:hypothetical protein
MQGNAQDAGIQIEQRAIDGSLGLVVSSQIAVQRLGYVFDRKGIAVLHQRYKPHQRRHQCLAGRAHMGRGRAIAEALHTVFGGQRHHYAFGHGTGAKRKAPFRVGLAQHARFQRDCADDHR